MPYGKCACLLRAQRVLFPLSQPRVSDMIADFLEKLFGEAGGDICIYDEDTGEDGAFETIERAAEYAATLK